MTTVVTILLNLVFAAFLFYAAIKVKVRKQINVVSMNYVFLCFGISAVLNALFILFSLLKLEALSCIVGYMVYFIASIGSTYIASNFLLSLNTTNRTVISLFEVISISAAAYMVFMTSTDFSYSMSSGYFIRMQNVGDSKFSFLTLFYLVYVLILPLASVISCLIKIIRNKEQTEKLFLGYVIVAITFTFATLALVLGLSLFNPDSINYYNALFPFAFVILPMILWIKPEDEKLTLSFSLFLAKDFCCSVVGAGLLFSVPYMFSILIKPEWRISYYVLLLFWNVILLVASWYLSKHLYGRYAAKEEFNRVGYRISEENQLLQYLQYYTENIPSSKLDAEYNVGTLNKTSDDIMDFIKIDLNSYLIVFGEIKNNTPEIRRNMLVLKSIYRTIFDCTPDLKLFVEKVNDYIFKNIPKNSEIQIFFALVDFNMHKISYVNAGLPFVGFFDSDDKTVAPVEMANFRLGENSDISSQIDVKSMVVKGGDCFYVCADENADSEKILDNKFKYSGMGLSMLELKYRGMTT
ncbi:MAG: SpoIIE family protein phosphatase [Treponemataceae bacterium]|nr:SpoIIE family protein phosphatase [Treponemataceae bacterium]